MPILETIARDALADALNTTINLGGAASLVFETAGDVEVATCLMSDPAFGAAASGVLTAAAIADDTDATGGLVNQASIYNGNAAKIMELSVAVSGSEVDMSNLTVSAGDAVSVSTLPVTMPAT